MSNAYDKDHEDVVLEPADETVISHAISPETGFVTRERMSKRARVIASFNAFAQISDNLPLDGNIEFF
jgi:hypothetical protein